MYYQKLNYFLVLLIILSVAQSAYGKDYSSKSKTNKNTANSFTKSKDYGYFSTNDDCLDDECGPLDSLPRIACSDGSLMKIGPCTRKGDGTCSWTLKPCTNDAINTPKSSYSQSSSGRQTNSYQGNDMNQLNNRNTQSQYGSNYQKGRTSNNNIYNNDGDYKEIFGGYSDDDYETFSYENRHFEGYNRGIDEYTFYNQNNRTNEDSRYFNNDNSYDDSYGDDSYDDDNYDDDNYDDDNYDDDGYGDDSYGDDSYGDDVQQNALDRTLGSFYGYRSPIYQSVKSYLERHRQDSTDSSQNEDDQEYENDESNIEEIDMDDDNYSQRQYNRPSRNQQQGKSYQNQFNKPNVGKQQSNRPNAVQQRVNKPNGNQQPRKNPYNGQKQLGSTEQNQYNRPNIGKQQAIKPIIGQQQVSKPTVGKQVNKPTVGQQVNGYKNQNNNQNKINVGKQQVNRPNVSKQQVNKPIVDQRINSYQSQEISRPQNRPQTKLPTRPQTNYIQNDDYEEIEITKPTTQLQRYGTPNTVKTQITRPAIAEEALEGPEYNGNNRVNNRYTKEKQLEKIADVLDTLSELLRELKNN